MKHVPIALDRPIAAPPRFGVASRVALAWLAGCAFLLFVYWHSVVRVTPRDGDDYMRLLEVRDWLAGQSWWDVSQHRMNPPSGGLLQWSRIPDLPIAAFLLLLRPFGDRFADAATIAIVPLLLLGGLVAVMARAARRLLPGEAPPLIAAALVLASPYVLIQFLPTRVDHHGWQMLAAGAALLALLGRSPLRAGLLGGAAFAVGLSISIEGAPVAIAAGAVLGVRWLFDAREGDRYRGFLIGLAGGLAAIFVATQPVSAWGALWCDAISGVHVAAAGCCAIVATLGVRLVSGRAAGWRALALALAAGSGAVVFLHVAPACAGNPFDRLDPVVYRVWYLNILESMPVWRQTASSWITIPWFPLTGMLGCAMMIRRERTAEARWRWALVLVLAMVSLAVGLLLRRAAGGAQVMAVPGAVALIEALRHRAGSATRPLVRILGGVAAFVVPSPLMALYLAALLTPEPPPSPADRAAAATDKACDARCATAPIAALPAADILAPLDNGPSLLYFTHHRVVAGSYHRNDRAMADVIHAFAGTPEEARRIALARHVRYVLIDPTDDEAGIYRRIAPRGLMARLLAGRPPGWLTPVPLDATPLRLWRVADRSPGLNKD